ncbi:MAG: iron-containing alcohol dehydrogenase [Anaerovoracaceae bacterium]|jgi:alcohol dehydrogenase
MFAEYNHKTKVIFGLGAISELGSEAEKYGKKAMILCDQGVIQAGILEKATKALTEKNISYMIFDQIKPNPRDEDCDKAAKIAEEAGADIIIGLGGGSAMDTAKAAALVVTNGGPTKKWDWKLLDKEMLPVICVPTTSGTGSEVTFCAVITDKEREYKMSMFDPENLVPKVAIVDPELTFTLPASLTASTGVDALTHAIEAYTSKLAHPLTDGYALHAIRLISENLEDAFKDPSNAIARSNMMIASLMAGIAFINSNVGAVHAISETVGGKYDTPHGIANSIFLPFVMEYNAVTMPEKHSEIASYLGVEKGSKTLEEHAKAGIDYIKSLNARLNIPTMKDLGYISSDDFALIAERSSKNALSDDNGREINKEGYLSILEAAYGI